MNRRSSGRAWKWLAVAGGMAVAAYGACVGVTWLRYGHAPPPRADERDELLDRFMPVYDVAERHHVRVAAPAGVTLAAAREMNLHGPLLVRAIITAREVVLGAESADRPRPRGLLAEMEALGWGVLADVPGREVVVGAVTRPWEADVTFRALPPAEFAAFSAPGYVKIVWTLRAEPITAGESIFRTETRASATDGPARARFRRYWAVFAPGIVLIRRAMLGPLREDAERRARSPVNAPSS